MSQGNYQEQVQRIGFTQEMATGRSWAQEVLTVWSLRRGAEVQEGRRIGQDHSSPFMASQPAFSSKQNSDHDSDGTRKERELALGYITELTTAAHGWPLTNPACSRDKGSHLVASPQLSRVLLLFTSICIKLFSESATHIQ